MHIHSQAMPLEGEDKSPEKEGDRTFNYASGGATALPVEDALSQIFKELGKINQRIDSVEFSRRESSPGSLHRSPPIQSRARENPWDSLNQQGSGSVGSNPNRENSDVDVFKDIQQEFNTLKSSVEKVVLPSGLKLHDSRSAVLTVLSKCGRYIETALKLLSQIKEGDNVDLNPLSITLIANLKYLQDEYAALLVNGKFDKGTSQLFRSLQTHNSGFNSQQLQNVRVAAELSRSLIVTNRLHSLVVLVEAVVVAEDEITVTFFNLYGVHRGSINLGRIHLIRVLTQKIKRTLINKLYKCSNYCICLCFSFLQCHYLYSPIETNGNQ